MSVPLRMRLSAPTELQIEAGGVFVSLPPKASAAILTMVREAAYGSVTLHFKEGQLCGVDRITKERVEAEP